MLGTQGLSDQINIYRVTPDKTRYDTFFPVPFEGQLNLATLSDMYGKRMLKTYSITQFKTTQFKTPTTPRP
jgi:hypothetical protein